MQTPQVPQCPKCGANVPRVNGEWSRQCAYCQTWFTMAMPAAPPAPAPLPVQPPVRVVINVPTGDVARTARRGCGVAGVVAFVGIFAAVIAVGALIRKITGEHLQWDSGMAPQEVTLPGVNGRFVLGRYRVLRMERGVPTTAHVGLFDANTGDRRWGTDSLGRFSEDQAGRSVHALAVGDRAVVTATSGLVRVLDLATGNLRANVQLTDVALSLCPLGDSRSVWIEVSDQNHMLLDTVTGVARPNPAPAQCSTQNARFSDECSVRGAFHPQAACAEARGLTLPGMRVSRTLTANGVQIAIGQHSPGTGYPMLAAFNANGVVWQRPLSSDPRTARDGVPDMADLVRGVIYVPYESNDRKIRLVAIDAATGRDLWESTPPDSSGSGPDTMTVTADRVYLPHWTWLDVFDAQTGAHLRTIGRW